MRIETEEGRFWATPHDTNPDSIIVNAAEREILMSMWKTIQLAGVGHGHDFDDIAIYRVDDTPLVHHYEMELDRGTLVLWFEFEALNFHKM